MNTRVALRTVFSLLLLAVAGQAQAQSLPDVGEMFANFSDSAVILMDLSVGIAFVCGIAISVFALMKLKDFAEDPRAKLSVPIGLFAVGAALIVLPGTLNMATETLALGANTGKDLLSLDPSGGGTGAVESMAAAMKGILLFVKLIGHIAFIRGFLMLKKMAEGGGQIRFGQALTHIIFGAAAININMTASLLAKTIAPGMGAIPFLTGG